MYTGNTELVHGTGKEPPNKRNDFFNLRVINVVAEDVEVDGHAK